MEGLIDIKNGTTEFRIEMSEFATFIFPITKFTVFAKKKTNGSPVILQFANREEYMKVSAEGRLSVYLIISAME
jgi:hypothetical protein